MKAKFKENYSIKRKGRWKSIKSKPGLRMNRSGSMYSAHIYINNEYIYLGKYKTPELAKTAYIDYLLNEQSKFMD